MPSQEEKICPLFRVGKEPNITIGESLYCLKEKCAFWSPGGGACSIQVIATKLSAIANK